MKLTDAKGGVVSSFTYGTYGELLSGSTGYSRFLYNGRYGVTTDDNGLYYMRQRYYGSELKRFVNQDVVKGSISNSQSLNRYSYVQGNPVSYTDPFGLSPLSGFFEGTMWVHCLYGVLGFAKGPIGIAANFADAIVYGVVDKDPLMAVLSVAACVASGSRLAGYSIKGGKWAKAATSAKRIEMYAQETYMGLSFVKGASNLSDSVYALYNKYFIEKQKFGPMTFFEGRLLLAETVLCGLSVDGAWNASKELQNLEAMAANQIAGSAVSKGTGSLALSSEEAEKMAFNAIHGPNKADYVVLGKYGNGGPDAYTNVAKDINAQYFQLDNWNELTQKYSDDEIWKINEKFLDIQTSSGREIYLSHNPFEYISKNDFYSREVQYLLDNGYKFVQEGDIWHAIR